MVGACQVVNDSASSARLIGKILIAFIVVSFFFCIRVRSNCGVYYEFRPRTIILRLKIENTGAWPLARSLVHSIDENGDFAAITA